MNYWSFFSFFHSTNLMNYWFFPSVPIFCFGYAPPLSEYPCLYGLWQGTSLPFLPSSAMPFCTQTAAGLSPCWVPDRKTGYSTDLYSAMERALPRMWFSLPAPPACWHCCPLLPSTRCDPTAPSIPRPYNSPPQKESPCFPRFTQHSCRGKTALSPCLVC